MIEIRLHARFRRDLRRQLRHLAENADERWIEGLRAGLDEAFDLLARHPRAGAAQAERDAGVLCRLVLRRVPYVLYYAVEGREVWILRLFHARQDRPAPSWPEPSRKPGRRRA